jgi:hypothetical protein
MVEGNRQFRLPNSSQRLTIIGRTGSGKSMMGAWVLATSADIDKRPWLVIDYKYEGLFRDPFVKHLFKEIMPTAAAPKKPGLYIVHPRPDEGAEIEDLLWRVWERGRTGVFVDEGYMLPDKAAFQALLTQGRSKHIPMIICSQRPVAMSRFAFSEADYFSVFKITDDRDWKTVSAFAPIPSNTTLAEFNSWWYDVAQDKTWRLKPVPHRNIILNSLSARAPRRLLFG